MSQVPLIEVRNLTKRYGGVVAMADMNLSVEAGTIHAVVGENGAGKSTLMKVLAGAVHADSGDILLEGKPITIGTPNEARRNGIGIVYQELSLFPERSVLANLFVNHEPTRGGLISLSAMEEQARPVLDQLGLNVDLRGPLNRLTIGEQQLVELCRVLLERPRLLILDEPNSALNERETERLFAVLNALRSAGITMLYVSHRLEEVFAISDRITMTRNGRDVRTAKTNELTIPQVIEGMIGAQREALFPPPLPMIEGKNKRALSVSGLTGGKLRDVTFTARPGEIVGLAGLEGSGVADLLEMLFGTRRATSGSVSYPDDKGLPRSPTEAARRGICLVPADRRKNGLMLDKSILFNISNVVVGARNDGPLTFLPGKALERAQRQIEALRIKAESAFIAANALSGGNQQKVVIGKWLEIGPDVFLLDDPTRGVDVGAKREIYGLIRRMSAEGGIVLFSSTELPELIGLCDRILIIYQGRLAGQVSGSSLDSRTILHLVNTGESPQKVAS
ncbi:MAG: sugar ABC transporter ATP-binding protein [Devosia sp.]